jgi:hypothetical protein
MRLVCSVGTNDLGHRNEHYDRWNHMLQRCYNSKFQQNCPTYVGSSVCQEWLTLSNFSIWCGQFQWQGMQLDKDLLAPEKTGKLYCPEFCVPVPHWLNSLFIDSRAARGQYAQGVCFEKSKQKFRSQLRVDGKSQFLGYFDTEREAALTYQIWKQTHVRMKFPQIRLLPRGEEIVQAIRRKYFTDTE